MSNLELTQDQQLFQDSLRKTLASCYDFHTRHQSLLNKKHWHQDVWQQLSDLGLFALAIPQSHGGLGGSVQDIASLIEVLGEFLVIEPVIPNLLGIALLSQANDPDLMTQYATSLASGEMRILPALQLPADASLIEPAQLKLSKNSSTWVLNGKIPMVSGAERATHFLVEVQLDQGNHGCFLLPSDQVKQQAYTLIDDSESSDLIFDHVTITTQSLLSFKTDAQTLLQPLASAYLSAEALGICKLLNQKTIAYTKQRQQFGQPISKFQVLQHRMVEMFLLEEQLKSMSYTLRFALDNPSKLNSYELLKLVYQCKLLTNQISKQIGEQSVQLHGGMGVSDELDIAHYFRRLTCIRIQWGDDAFCLSRIQSLLNA